jgi:hypothetical protein
MYWNHRFYTKVANLKLQFLLSISVKVSSFSLYVNMSVSAVIGGKKHIVGCTNNIGEFKLLPEYSQLLSLLYELGAFANEGPEEDCITNFHLPTMSQSKFNGKATGAGFVTLERSTPNTSTENSSEFYEASNDGMYVSTYYSRLITEIEWESDTEVQLMFMSQPYGMVEGKYYDPKRVYPIVDLDNNLMIVNGVGGTLKTQEYSSKIFVYTNAKCNIKLRFIMGNPKKHCVLNFKNSKVIPEYMTLHGESIIVAYNTLLEDGSIDYQPASGFEQVAKRIKEVISSYSRPYLSDIFNQVQVEELPNEADRVIICQGIKLFKTDGAFWSYVKGGIQNQYGDRSDFGVGDWSLGNRLSPMHRHFPHESQRYNPVVHCTLCVPIKYQGMEGIIIKIVSEGTKWGDLAEPKYATRYVSYNNEYSIYSARFELKTGPNDFAISFTREDKKTDYYPDSTWKVKVTFNRVINNLPPFEIWDPFHEKIIRCTEPGFGEYKPDPDRTVARALLIGAGGGGSGYDRGNWTNYSGAGGGRGFFEILDLRPAGFVLEKFPDLFYSFPIQYKVGTGGVAGKNGNYTQNTGGDGEDTMITNGSRLPHTIKGGIGAMYQVSLGDGGGGGSYDEDKGASNHQGYFKGGRAGQGSPGEESKPGKGGNGGDGPSNVKFPTVIGKGEGGKGTTIGPGAGGGAGGILTTDGHFGYGGDGGAIDSSGTTVIRNTTAGGNGYVCILSRYIKY